jgi:hypothetical protein
MLLLEVILVGMVPALILMQGMDTLRDVAKLD